MAKKILVACGTAIATSTVVAKKIERLCKESGIDFVIMQSKAEEALSKARTFQPDVIVSTIEIPEGSTVPVIDGVPFLTGEKLQETITVLLEVLKK